MPNDESQERPLGKIEAVEENMDDEESDQRKSALVVVIGGHRSSSRDRGAGSTQTNAPTLNQQIDAHDLFGEPIYDGE